MKIFVSLFLILTHLFSTVSFSMNMHECGGEKSFAYFGIHFTQKCNCNHDSEDHKKDCCSDKKLVVKGDLKEKITQKVFITKAFDFFDTIELPLIEFQQKKVTTSIDIVSLSSEYPPGYSPPLYILYRSILI